MPRKNQTSLYKLSTIQYLAFYVVATGLLFFGSTEMAQASVLDNFGNAVLDILNSTFLRVIAIIAVIMVGLGALSGRLEWSKAIWVIGGVVIVFGATGIVDFFIDNAGTI